MSAVPPNPENKPENTGYFPHTPETLFRNATNGGPLQTSSLNALAKSYMVPLAKLAASLGIPQQDQADAVAEAMAAVFNPMRIAGVDRKIGKFRSYLSTALYNTWSTHLRRRKRKHTVENHAVPFEDEHGNEIAHTISSDNIVDELDKHRANFLLLLLREEMETHGGCPRQRNFLWNLALGLEPQGRQNEMAHELGISHSAFRQSALRFRRHLRQKWKDLVATNSLDPTDIEHEALHLLKLAIRH